MLKTFQLKNDFLKIEVMDMGATWLSCQVKRPTTWQEVLLGCKKEDYATQKVYLGASIGRYANRIANSCFQLNGKTYHLNANQSSHQLHGGQVGFDKKRWLVKEKGEDFITFHYFSINKEEGFPGNCEVDCTYRLIKNAVCIEYHALCDQDCPINLTNHAYFNLQNAELGTDIRHHTLQINADYFLPVNAEGIPIHPLKKVDNTAFDFRQTKLIAQDFGQEEQKATKGYDHSFLLNKNTDFALHLQGTNGLSLRVRTSQPAVHIYTGNFLAHTPTRQNNVFYGDFSGIAIETQALPDTPNHPEWWQFGGMSKANQSYTHWTLFEFL